MFIPHNYELTMNLSHWKPGDFTTSKTINVMNVLYFGDIKTASSCGNFGIMVVKFVPFAIGGFHAIYSK
jgi:hypothetical protein